MPQYFDWKIIIMSNQTQQNLHQNTVLTSHQHYSSFQSQTYSSQSQSQLQNPQLDPEQILKTLKTLKKLKKISKSKKLTDLKSSNKQVNTIFKNMSYFFTYKAKQSLKKKQQQNRLRNARKQALKSVGIRKTHKKSEILSQQSHSPSLVDQFSAEIKQNPVQLKSLKCYVCKKKFTQIHHFYDCLCVECGNLNFQKRNQKADLNGYVALVTGARIKIGFQIAVKLLRDGATVIATTRFWKDAFLRYQKQPDFHKWSQRLILLQCDFTSSTQVSHLIETIKQKFTKLDILINNAAQTIVRPKQFYFQQIVNQTQEIPSLPDHLKQFQPNASPNIIHRYPSLYLPQKQSTLMQLTNQQCTITSQIQKLRESSSNKIDHSVRDQFDQPLDKRQKNTWVQKLDQVTLIDCYSTQLVNSIVPFHLISQLKPLMKKISSQKPSFIINVSSMEGVFNRVFKQTSHPHTNMAKAALNMITKTSARQFAEDYIYMNSVDTGWVTQENPCSFKIERSIPLDCVDGAMRVLDPIYMGLNNKFFHFEKFLKDYKQSKW